MIQFNLLPDVKLEFIKARKLKRLVTLISIVAGAAGLFVMLLMLTTVDIVQKKAIRDANNDITTYSKQLKNISDLDKILTVQNQLNTLTDLHDKKVVASRLFSYISQVTPSQATISSLSVDFLVHTMTVSGGAPGLGVVNAYTDTLKATTYKTDAAGSTDKKAFSGIVLSSFGRATNGASYTITLTFDPIIFNNANTVTLTIPSGSTSNTSNLFQAGT